MSGTVITDGGSGMQAGQILNCSAAEVRNGSSVSVEKNGAEGPGLPGALESLVYGFLGWELLRKICAERSVFGENTEVVGADTAV